MIEDTRRSSINCLLNANILGKNNNKYQYVLPSEDDPNRSSKRIGIINFENAKVRQIIKKSISLLIFHTLITIRKMS